MNIIEVQKNFANLDGWLLYDCRRSNNHAITFLQIPDHVMLTRRFFYWIPKKGEPLKFVSAIVDKVLDHLPGEKKIFRTWQDLENLLGQYIKGKVAMEYNTVDAGTIDMVRRLGIEVVSSGDLLQRYTCFWDQKKYQSHLKAARVLDEAVEKAWQLIKTEKKLDEYQVQQFLLREFEKQNCITEDPPIVAVNAHSADPHYLPEKKGSTSIKAGDFILIDLFCKLDQPDSVYADITRVGVKGKPTARQQEIFDIVKKGREAAIHLVRDRFAEKVPLKGWEVDQACRDVIEKSGFGKFFIHRTGHNVGERVHGNGANIDNFGTRDDRLILPGTCFTLEPGIYLPQEFGVRLEYDVFVHPNGNIEITGGEQTAIKCV